MEPGDIKQYVPTLEAGSGEVPGNIVVGMGALLKSWRALFVLLAFLL